MENPKLTDITLLDLFAAVLLSRMDSVKLSEMEGTIGMEVAAECYERAEAMLQVRQLKRIGDHEPLRVRLDAPLDVRVRQRRPRA